MAITRFSGSNITTGNKKYASFDTGYPSLMGAPTATDGGTGTTVSVAFTAQTGATSYTVLSSPGSLTGTGASSPVTVSGLTTGTPYTFQVRATNSVGTGPYSAASNSVTPASPYAFTQIATATPTTGSVVFSSIPQTFKHLQIRIVGRQSSGTSPMQALMYMNGDTYNGNYQWGYIENSNGTYYMTSANNSGIRWGFITGSGDTASYFGGSIIDIYDYTNTTTQKSVMIKSGYNISSTNQWFDLSMGMFKSNSAITELRFDTQAGNFVTGSRVSLYGIKGN